MNNAAKILVVGTGYVGLTTGACLAELGHHVVCADIDATKIHSLKSGHIPIHEPGLDEVVQRGLESGRLSFVLGAEHAIADAGFVFFCLPTPQDADGRADLSYVKEAATELGPLFPPNCIVVNKSTVPVGSSEIVERALNRSDVFVVSNPEFLREGVAVSDFLSPDRIVIGARDSGARQRVATLYDGVDAPILLTDSASAEATKYASNAFLATKISFANAVAALCESVGADVTDVLTGVGYDRRIGDQFLRPGPGWGGSCFPKDTRAMVAIAEDGGYDFAFLKSVIEVNTQQRERVVEKIRLAANGDLAGVRVGALGIAFKAGTDDVRESPAVDIIRRLVDEGATVVAHDPIVDQCPVPGVSASSDPYEASADADVVVILTEWPQFAELDLTQLGMVMAKQAIVDARNLLDPEQVRAHGFTYAGIGRS